MLTRRPKARPAQISGKQARRYRRIRFVLIWVLVANLGVALGKGGVGFSIGSISMVADAFHSLMDGSSNIIGIIGITLASRPRDESHAYGHTKFETFASLGVVLLLLITALEIGRSVIDRLMHPQAPDVGVAAFAVMIATIAVNIAISSTERRAGRRLNSNFLVADSRHTMSDVWVSMSVIVSLVAAALGYPLMDAIVAGIIAIIIAYWAVRIMQEASSVLLDRAIIDPGRVKEVCMSVKAEGLLDCHKIRTRGSEAGYWIDLHLLVEPQMTTKDSHRIASLVERRLKNTFGDETDTVIHIEPGR
ncbi:MAG: cation transporter [Thermoleophilia bacterium]|nr:cation transporter [Thermoleophilia bacterium]